MEIKKNLHTLAKSEKLSYPIYKIESDIIELKILKDVNELICIANKLLLYIKGLSGSILTTISVKSKEKPSHLNQIVKPLLTLLKLEEVDSKWIYLYSRGLFNICVCYENDTSHPNHKIISNFLSYSSEVCNRLYNNVDDSNNGTIQCIVYFEMMFDRYRDGSYEKYNGLNEIMNNSRLMRLFIHIICKYCSYNIIQKCIDYIIHISNTNSTDCNNDIKYIFTTLFTDSNVRSHTDADRKKILNQILLYLYDEVSKPSLLSLEILMHLLNTYDKEMLPYSKIYIKQSLKLINMDMDYNRKRQIYDIFTRILTLSYVQDSEIQPETLDDNMLDIWKQGNEFLLEFRSNKLYNVDIPDIHSVKLRPYQMEGIAWVNFLFKYNLSGALCDDMGLGKTIQSLIIVMIYTTRNKGMKSLIICPNSLTKHWEVEAIKHYQGYPMTVKVLDKTFNGNWKQFKDINLFIISDSLLTKSVHLFEKEKFLVGVLDEAHLIKNEKSKLSKNIKMLNIQHKLALTGTPIQNNLLELWSIFDFLMPNYLGTRDEFKKSFARLFNLNLINIDIEKMDLNDDQTKDLQLLHQKVLPFIMRRLKDQVLKDLPEKIIQDYYCELTDVQKKVYKQFEDSDLQVLEKTITTLETSTNNDDNQEKKKIPLLQSLICMRKVCNHPYLIGNKYFKTLTAEEEKDIKQFENSGKLRGLKTLFEQLGFESEEDNYDNTNKILIFTRFLDTISLLESFIRTTFPTVKYVKIDGQIDSNARYSIIDKFFNDYDIKVMILTTKVGGLGLNLSCANIVVMFDHDFNPMNDLQAIERAHRLGQKKVVNVFRFIMKDTLEERIMGYVQL